MPSSSFMENNLHLINEKVETKEFHRQRIENSQFLLKRFSSWLSELKKYRDNPASLLIKIAELEADIEFIHEVIKLDEKKMQRTTK